MTVTIEMAHQLNNQCVIIGWQTVIQRPDHTSISMAIEGETIELEPNEILFFVREDVNEAKGLSSETQSGFIFIKEVNCPVQQGVLSFFSDSFFLKKKQNKLDFSAHSEKDFWVLIEALMNNGKKVHLFLKQYGFIEASISHAFDNVFFLDDKTVFINGWVFDEVHGGMVELLPVSSSMEICVSRFERGDLKSQEKCGVCWQHAGFSALMKFAEKPIPSQLAVLFRSMDGQKKKVSFDVTEVVNPKKHSPLVLNSLKTGSGLYKMLEEAYGPPLLNMWNNYYQQLDILPEVTTYGDVPEKPKLSIVIPLYGRIDFMDYQLAVFATDPLFKNEIEIIYVLDDPDRFGDAIDEVARVLFQLQCVPFKVVTYGSNLGYARANNIGVNFATSSMVLLLNSDVFPKEKGWTERLLEIYDGLEAPGALGCKLLFEDDSIQHAGMTFQRREYFDGMWANIHPHKGLPDLNKEFVVKEVPAVTAACMLVEKRNYEAVYGLSETYVLGDFEDSDLCLKLMERDLKIYYASEPVLYHLERQSQALFQDKSWKFKVTVFNCWQHTSRWDKTIENVMERFNG